VNPFGHPPAFCVTTGSHVAIHTGRKTMTVSVLALLLLAGGGPPLSSAPQDVSLDDGTVVRVEAGTLQVPESRRRPTQRRITLPYYRLKSDAAKPAAPVFLLAGGPGSSWLDQLKNDENAREVAFYRTVADVVLFDQRGGGHALPKMSCPQTAQLPAGQQLDLAAVRSAMRALLTDCRDHWLREGVDLAAYNTVENAADVNDLRLALGYGKVTLVGGSYGSHLALEVMRQFPEAVERAVLFGVEGPDHTWDDPAATLATLARIAAHAEASEAFSGRVPEGGILKAFERVLARLEAAPQSVTVSADGTSHSAVVTADLVRRLARRDAGRRSRLRAWPEMILALDRGDYSLPARAALDLRELRLPPPVHWSMDCASGVSPARRTKSRDDPARRLFGDLNFEYEALCDLWPSEDLGDAFRTDVVSNVPTLLVHGNWDLSTPIENAREVAASLGRGQLVEVGGGGHGALYNLYEHWPPMHDLMKRFLTGQSVDFPRTVAMPDASFQAPTNR
jgi:pimeloyl-ACP methyl ester carboxylesterase